jgi:hypothetical protein
MIRNPFRSAAVMASALAITTALVVQLRADDKKAEAAPSQLAKDMIGAWVLVGTPGNVGEPPAAGGRYKFLTGKHWTITQADAATGEVVFHHGGTYTLDGADYAETVEYANKNTADLIKKTHKFKMEVVGDTLTQTGLDNPWTEVWKRLK